jgi:hypothetical protein
MDPHSIQVQAVVSLVMPLLIQLAKRSRSQAFAWIDQNRPTICALTSGMAAILTSMGIEIVHDAHSLTVRWADSATQLHGFATFVVAALFQFGAQQAAYVGLWRRVVPSPSNELATAKS